MLPYFKTIPYVMTQVCRLRKYSALCAFHSTDLDVIADAIAKKGIMVHGCLNTYITWGKTP